MAVDHGWLRPERYRSIEEEQRGVRASVGLCDISPTRKLDVKGKALPDFLTRCASAHHLPRVGQAQRVTLNGAEGVGLCCRLSTEHLALLTPPELALSPELDGPDRHTGEPSCYHVTDLTSALAALQLAGPKSQELLRKLTDLDLSLHRFADLTCAQGSLAKIHALLVRADVGRTLAYEIYCGREFGTYLWETVRDAGREFELIPFGIGAQRLLGQGN